MLYGIISAVGYLILGILAVVLAIQGRTYLKLRHIHHPFVYPIIGSLCRDLLVRPLKFFRDTSAKSNGFSFFLVGIRPIIIISDPDAIRVVLKNHMAYFKAKDLYQKLEPGFGKGLVTNDGESWKKMHDIIVPFFQPSNRVKHIPHMNDVVRTYSIPRLAKRVGEKESFNIAIEMERLLLNLFCDVAFNYKCREHEKVQEDTLSCLYRLSTNVTRAMMGDVIPYWESIRPKLGIRDWFAEDLVVLLDACNQIIDTRVAIREKEGKDPYNDVLTLLLDADIPRKQVLDEVVTLLGAGHDTTAALTMFTLMLLSKNPEAEEKLLQEIDDILGDKDEVTREDIEKMSYLPMVLNESMRLYPPVPCIGREAVQDEEINGTFIPKGVTLLINPITLNYMSEYYPDPTKFDPERWTKENTKTRPRHCFVPFGGGQRECIGRYFALMEVSIVLPLLLRKFKFVYDPTKKWVPHVSISYRPLGGLHFTVEERKRK